MNDGYLFMPAFKFTLNSERTPMNFKMPIMLFRLSLCVALTVIISPAGAVGTKLQNFEYAVISAVINHGLSDDAAKIVIAESTTGESVDIFDAAQTPEEIAKELDTTPAALREWSLVNRNRYKLSQQLALDGPYHLLADDDRSQIFDNPDPDVNWQQFHARFPDAVGIVRVSRPSTDDIAKTALLYLEFECGTECGSGRLINLVQTVPDQWQVTSGSLVWITAPE